METLKSITFMKNWERIDLTVDLNKLSGLARDLAENIYTTINDDDAGKIILYGKLTFEDSMRHRGNEYIKKMRQGYGDDVLKTNLTSYYLWDGLKHYETTEQYFERHAKSISKNSEVEKIGIGIKQYISYPDIVT